MTALTFYGGVGEIGGNKVLLEDDGTRLLLDFGLSFLRNSMFFEEFIRPRPSTCVCDLTSLGILPQIQGLYREDIAGGGQANAPVDAVLLTHAHADHAGCIPYIKKEIPVYCTDTTRAILDCCQQTSKKDVYMEYIDVYDRNGKKSKTAEKRPYVEIDSGHSFTVGGIEVLPFNVDHSIPGACGFIIFTGKGPVVYTGDYRFHGPNGAMTSEFFKQCERVKPVLVITEATRKNIAKNDDGLKDEQSVESRCIDTMATSQGLIVADFGSKDLDRLKSMYNACRKTGRKLAINTKTARLMECLGDTYGLPRIDDSHIAIYCPEKKQQRSSTWEKPYLEMDNAVDADAVSVRQREYTLCAGYYNVQEFFDIKPSAGSVYLFSHSEAWGEEDAFGDERLRNWLGHFGIAEVKAHASGHASYEEVDAATASVNALDRLMIHTGDKGQLSDAPLKCGIGMAVKQAY